MQEQGEEDDDEMPCMRKGMYFKIALTDF